MLACCLLYGFTFAFSCSHGHAITLQPKRAVLLAAFPSRRLAVYLLDGFAALAAKEEGSFSHGQLQGEAGHQLQEKYELAGLCG